MAGLTQVLLSGLSGLRASQTGLGVASQNIANVNTPGYVRAEITLAPRTQLGVGGGVEVSAIRRAADRFLASASYIAEATRGAASVRSDILARAQANFGDPNSETSLFATLDRTWSSLTGLGVDPASTLRRGEAVGALQATFAEVRRVGQSVQSLIAEADQRISDAVTEAQSLIDRIASLNTQIQLAARAEADTSSTENAQAALIDQLSAIMDINVSPLPDGGVGVRTRGGALLVGTTPAKLSYTPSTAPFATHGVIGINPELGTQANIEPFLLGGQLAGLLQARDRDLPSLAEALGGLSSTLADGLNAVHNENASTPAIGNLLGRQTGLLGSDALGFTGKARVGIVDAAGVLRERLSIDFGAKTITAEAPAAVFSFAADTITAFASALNAALGAATPAGGASFANGALALNVGAGGGLVVQQDTISPSARAGRGFSHFFGLNDLVSRPTPLFFESGVKGADVHGLAAGGALTYQVRDSAGRYVAARTVSIAGALANPASDWNALVGALNTAGTGLGEFGTFSLDAATGRLAFAANAQYQVDLVGDSTTRGSTGVSLSALHGLSSASTAGRALEVDVNSLIAAAPGRLAVGRPNLAAALGQRVIEAGDNRGSAALAAARDAVRNFPAAGALSSQTTTFAIYAARLGGEAGRLANDAKRSADGAEAVAAAAADRRGQVEGVNLDDELVRMTTYQNAYAAAARVIQAAKEMLDVLLSIGYR